MHSAENPTPVTVVRLQTIQLTRMRFVLGARAQHHGQGPPALQRHLSLSFAAQTADTSPGCHAAAAARHRMCSRASARRRRCVPPPLRCAGSKRTMMTSYSTGTSASLALQVRPIHNKAGSSRSGPTGSSTPRFGFVAGRQPRLWPQRQLQHRQRAGSEPGGRDARPAVRPSAESHRRVRLPRRAAR